MTIIKKKLGSGSTRFVKYSTAKPGETLVVGKFLGTEEVPGFPDPSKLVPIHSFSTEDDETVKLKSAAQLNSLLSKVALGSHLEIIYLGKEKVKTKQGITVDVNQFEVNELVDTDEIPF